MIKNIFVIVLKNVIALSLAMMVWTAVGGLTQFDTQPTTVIAIVVALFVKGILDVMAKP